MKRKTASFIIADILRNKHDPHYDLLQLPSGDYIEVMEVAMDIISWNQLAKIPLSDRIRNRFFFTCPICGTKQLHDPHGKFPNSNCDYCFFHDTMNKTIELTESPLTIEEELFCKRKAVLNIVNKGRIQELTYIFSDVLDKIHKQSIIEGKLLRELAELEKEEKENNQEEKKGVKNGRN